MKLYFTIYDLVADFWKVLKAELFIFFIIFAFIATLAVVASYEQNRVNQVRQQYAKNQNK